MLQPLATEVGLRILREGGNAADAAVAVAAALNVAEPTSTGIGGDCFALYFDAATRKVSALNGSGRSPMALTLEVALHDCELGEPGLGVELPLYHAHSVTVPGAAAGWEAAVREWGTKSLAEVLAPAIALAEEGVPVSPTTAGDWARGVKQLRGGPHGGELLMPDGRPPAPGDVFRNPNLAATFRDLAEHGAKEGFYKGRVADAIIEILREKGGVMTHEDLEAHEAVLVEPLHAKYRGVDIYECPPNGQGITALVALRILQGIDIGSLEAGSDAALHAQIEALRLAFADTQWYVRDPDDGVPCSDLLSEEYIAARRALLDLDTATSDVRHGSPFTRSDTVSFSVVDGSGNACSFINSNYMGFGSGLVPRGCGFTLQNRGQNFRLWPGHPNCLMPGRRPYHTIIPGMALRDGELFSAFSCMGGFMQPQGHVQLMCNMLDYGMNPQAAIDAPRFCIMVATGEDPDGSVTNEVGVEESMDPRVIEGLRRRGHKIRIFRGVERETVGRAQIIIRDSRTGVLWGGSDGRADGLAMGW